MNFTKINEKLEKLGFNPGNKFYFICILNEIETNNGIISTAEITRKYGLTINLFKKRVKEYTTLNLIDKEIVLVNGQKYSKYSLKKHI